MPKREPKKSTESITGSVGSAPELPAAIAKQYGLHRPSSNSRKRAATAAAPDVAEGSLDSEPSSDAMPDLPVLADPKTDQAVDAIVADESDELLAAEDALQHGAIPEAPAKQGFWHRIGRFFNAWAHSPRARWITLIVAFGVLVGVFLVPSARYFVLNTAGVRSTAKLVVVDSTTRLPLKNVTVRIGGQQAQTNIEGEAKLANLKLGPQELLIERLAFAQSKKKITIGWGSNPQGVFLLTATGLQYTINVRDYVSDKPLAEVEATIDGLNALSDKKGIITFTVSDRDPKDMSVIITKKGYRNETVVLRPSEPQVGKALLVPSTKTFYVSNQSGKYDLYAADIDGKNKKTVLHGTGNEGDTMSLAVAPAGDWAAMVATRDVVRSKDGYLLRAITLVNEDGSTATTLERAEQIQLIDWVGTKVIYQVTVAGASAANAQRSRLIAYDYATNNRAQLATANQFNAIHVVKDTIYYVVSGTDPTAKPGLFRVRPDGTGRQTIWNKEIWTAWRSGYTTIALQNPEGWFEYSGSGTPTKASTIPREGRQYTTSPDATRAVWADVRDGKGVVIATDVKSGKETQIVAAEGLTYPLRWLNNTVLLYRVVTNGETADYAASTEGGPVRKVLDVTNAHGFTRY